MSSPNWIQESFTLLKTWTFLSFGAAAIRVEPSPERAKDQPNSLSLVASIALPTWEISPLLYLVV